MIWYGVCFRMGNGLGWGMVLDGVWFRMGYGLIWGMV